MIFTCALRKCYFIIIGRNFNNSRYLLLPTVGLAIYKTQNFTADRLFQHCDKGIPTSYN